MAARSAWLVVAILLGLSPACPAGEDLWPADAIRSDSPAPWIRSRLASADEAAGGARRTGEASRPTSALAPDAPAESAAAEGGDSEDGEQDHIETDRDSFTPATTTVGRNRIVLESAYTFIDNRSVPESHSFPEFLSRIGLSERVELRIGWNYDVGGAANTTSGTAAEAGTIRERIRRRLAGAGGVPVPPAGESEIERDSHISYGAKLALTRQEGFVPESAVILQGFTPTSGESSTTTFAGTYVLGWKLLSDCKLDAAVRYGTAEDQGDRFGVLAPSVVLRVPVGERWNAHAEWFGLFADHRHADSEIQYFSPGLHYLVTPDLEVGVRVGWGLTDQSARFFCNSGLGWRF